jgi:hypothetical protein
MGENMVKCITKSTCESINLSTEQKIRPKTHHKIVIGSIFLVEW